MVTVFANSAGLNNTVPVGQTGATSFTAYGVLTGGTTSTGAIQSIVTGTSGQVLVSNGSGAVPSFQTVSARALNIVSGTSSTVTANNDYLSTNSSQTTLTLSGSFNPGDTMVIEGVGAAGFVIAAGTGNTINLYGATATSSGGTLTTRDAGNTTNSAPGCRITIVNTAANTFWGFIETGSFVTA